MANETNLLHRISHASGSLSPALQRVAEVILASPEQTQASSLSELAARAGVADSTVSRFIRELGLDGFNQLRLGIAQAIYSRGPELDDLGPQHVYEGVLRGDPVEQVLGKVAYSSMESLRRTAELVSPDAIAQIIDLIHRASVVQFSAMGASATAAESAAMRFVRAGKRCQFFRDQTVQSMGAASLKPGDVLIAISDSGESDPIVSSADIARHHEATTVAITSNVSSSLARVCDIAVPTASSSASSAVYGESVASKWGQLLVVDALYASYATRFYDETADFLEEGYRSVIRPTRTGLRPEGDPAEAR